MPARDQFSELARYYDQLMEHVDYERWYLVALAVGGLLRMPFRHADLACGTGTLLHKLRRIGWHSIGLDLSYAMIHSGRRKSRHMSAAVADLRALPLSGTIDYLTCLFDSLNFLLREQDMQTAIAQFWRALRPGGVLYFDFVTERMVLDHFAGQQWTESNGGFTTSWSSTYDRKTCITDTHIRINRGVSNTISERIYAIRDIEDALHAAGFDILGMFDAENWRSPRKKTIRVDVVAVKGDAATYAKEFNSVIANVQSLFS